MTNHLQMLAIAAMLGAAPGAAMAQDEPGPITWVRYFTVEAEEHQDFNELIMEYDAPIFDAMLDEGKAMSWGMISPMTHSGDHWTHAIWVTAPSWASFDGMMERFMQAEQGRSEEENEELMEEFFDMVDPASIRDQTFRHLAFVDENEEGDDQLRYFRFGYYKALPMKGDEIEKLYDNIARPVLGPLEADGTIISAGFARQELVTTNEWTHMSWTALPSLGAMDAVDAAFAKQDEARSSGDQESLENTVADVLDFEAFRSTVVMVTHYKSAGD